MMKRFGLVALLTILLSAPACAATFGQVVRVAVGANGAWLDGAGAAFPVEFEAGGTAATSLSPHISAVGGLHYGFAHSYFRWNGGFRVTATDVDNPDFNVFLGIQYRDASKSAVGPGEWAPEAGFGWRPAPALWPNVVVGGNAGYGLQSNRVVSYLALRYLLPIK